ncbi:MAG: hypothetical protein HKN17_07010, partial [Rhodothermales bacterium]|nr:hypothetical protein [Rhodothermales bacterium]
MNNSAIRSSRKFAPLFTSRRDALAVSLAGGMMMGVAFPPIGFWPLAWGSMIPLFLATGSLSRDRVFLHGLAFFVPAFGIPFHWVA